MAESRSQARPATYEDVLALPEHVVGEIIAGELFVSPRPAPRHAVAKLTVYAREGVAHIWLLDPIQRILEVLRLEREQWVIVSVHANDEEVHVEPFAATLLPLSRLWVD